MTTQEAKDAVEALLCSLTDQGIDVVVVGYIGLSDGATSNRIDYASPIA